MHRVGDYSEILFRFIYDIDADKYETDAFDKLEGQFHWQEEESKKTD